MKHRLMVPLLLLTAVLYSSGSFGQHQERLKVSILGDSYSTFEGYLTPDTNYIWYYKTPRQQTDVSQVTQTWWDLFIKEHHATLEINNSFSGSTICNTGYNQEDYSHESFITRMDQLGDPDLIFVFGGTNDSWAGSPIGDYQYSDWTGEQLYAFRPAMAYMLDHMKKRYDGAQIYFILNDGLKDSINQSVIEICQHYDIQCIALSDIDKKSGHPSIKGMVQINDQISRYLQRHQKRQIKSRHRSQ